MMEKLLLDKTVKEFTVTKNHIDSDVTSGNIRKIDMNISFRIVYMDCDEEDAVTFESYIIDWIYNVKQKQLKPTSFDRIENTVKYQVVPYIGGIAINQLCSQDIEGMIQELREEYSHSTIKKAYEAVKACLEYAKKRGVIYNNPADLVELPRNNDDLKVKFWEDNEITVFVHEALRKDEYGERIYRLGSAFVFLLSTGIRVGEALALKWEDIDFVKSVAYINKNVALVKNRKEGKRYVMVEQSTKTKSGMRVVPLNQAALNALDDLKCINGDFDFVISNAKGGYMLHKNLDRTFKKILENCGLKKTGIHTLRHTFASKLFRCGTDIKTISEILGHSDVSVTSDIYVHVVQEQKMMAVKMADFI